MILSENRFVYMLESFCESSFFDIQTGQFIESGCLKAAAPDSLIECIVSFFRLPLILQGKPQIIVRFVIIGIRIGTDGFLHRLTKILFRPCKITVSKQTSSVSVVQPDISRIPAQTLQIVILRMIRGMPVLFHMQSVEEQVFRCFAIFWKRCRFGRFRHFCFDLSGKTIRDQVSAVCGTNTYLQTAECLRVILCCPRKCRYLLQFFPVDLHLAGMLR